MKNCISLFLAILLCLALSACGGKKHTVDPTNPNHSGEKQPQQNTAPGTDPGTAPGPVISTDLSTAAVIHIVINPEFKIHVDGTGMVSYVECLNDDANAVIAKVDISGKPFRDVLVSIIDETAKQGFLKDGGQIEVSVLVAEELADQIDSWNHSVMDSVTQALASTQLNAAISFQSDIADLKHQDGQPNQITPETDAQGNTIVHGEDGSLSIIDKNGNLLQVIITENDGTVITQHYDKNGNMVSEDRTAPDGSTSHPNTPLPGQTVTTTDSNGMIITFSYDQQGQIAFQREERPDGAWLETYFQNGVITKNIDQHTLDGITIRLERDFHSNGTVKQETTYRNGAFSRTVSYNANGTMISCHGIANQDQGTIRFEEEYYANGSLKSVNRYQDDTLIYSASYAENGQMLLQMNVSNQDGIISCLEEEFYPNGNKKLESGYENDNLRYYISYYENGNRSYECSYRNGLVISEVSYSENGNRTKERFVNDDGGSEDRTYRADGTSYAYYHDPNGAVFYYEFDAAGNQLLESHKQIQ